MTSENLIKYIANPESIGVEMTSKMEELIARYPYFSTARILYMKSLHQTKLSAYEKELLSQLIYIPSPRSFMTFIKNPLPRTSSPVFEIKQPGIVELQPIFEEEKPKIIKLQPVVQMKEIQPIPVVKETQPVVEDKKVVEDTQPEFVELLSILRKETSEIIDSQNIIEEKSAEEIIEKKIVAEEKIENNEQETEIVKETFIAQIHEPEIPETEPKTPIAEQKSSDGDDFFSETLANIYLKKGKYEKAMKIFKKLILQYPEKSAYFADQIRECEILIKN